MKLFSTSTHAKIDYLASIFFMASPWIFGFKESVPATWVMIAIGLMALLMALFTDYEGGMVRSIPMGVHLTADVFTGAFLASSPWLFGFADEVFYHTWLWDYLKFRPDCLRPGIRPATGPGPPTVDRGQDGFN